ncbi:polysaccharide deacetylase family protein [Aequorivita sp. F47161]|uniref:Polysaccharide deacetylase family protein n=1 Tax=Aequorivita vitellina TaxID=2874475 RepID=A0A9X1U1P7_9FLAO|nr:polysaccharide deacetylase family protein [Aequorivita vitellina]MCG2417723.1 polysaccharide deacetylase family protein [Aequorivita vitellina]
MPKFIQRFYPERIWAFSRNKNTVYLTFDDGPIPKVTPWVLATLKKHNAKATFFCIGDNVQKHPEIFKTILSQGHSVGNHTFNHVNGWKTKTAKYVDNVLKYEHVVLKLLKNFGIENAPSDTSNSKLLFRPPYGKMTSKQARILQKKGFKIVMWSIISYDYDANTSEEKCLQNVLNNIKPGSVIVFHDSLKAEKNLRFVLPKVLEFISEKGWECSTV